MSDWLSPEEREEFRAYNEKRYKEQHGNCLAQIEALKKENERLNEHSRDFSRQHHEALDEIQRLQRALHFWLPHVPAKGAHEVLMRTGDDAMLLAGYDPTEPVELDAEARGWITLNAEPQKP